MIRRAEETDAEIIRYIEQTCFTDPWSTENIRSEIKKETSYVILLFEGERCMGYACMEHLFEEGEILRIAVLPEFRRQGAGKMLMDNMKYFCEANGIEKVFLEVRSTNAPARALYGLYGFKEISVRKNYYGDCDAVIMEKKRIPSDDRSVF